MKKLTVDEWIMLAAGVNAIATIVALLIASGAL